MKNNLKCWICLLLAAFLAPLFLSANHSDGYYGLPGDDFSLEGALDLFKRSNSLEEFERELNSSDNYVNNLDLNNNGRIDYLRVVDHAEGDLHAIVIQALLGRGVSQDVAVIEVKRNRYGEAVVQIIGDEDLYGTAKIVEPYPYDDMVGTDYYDNYYDYYSPKVFVNVWAWPSVRYIFAPRYVVWVSPYYYDYYPHWYRTWNPHPYHVWHPHTVVYHRHYCVAPSYRIPEAHRYYGARRVSAPVVRQRTEQYVAEHGGRSNFTYGKPKDAVEVPRSRSLNRIEKSSVTTRPDRQRMQSPAEKPQTENRTTERARKPEAPSPNNRQREQSPVTKPPANHRRQETSPAKPGSESSNRRQVSPAREAPRVNNGANNHNRSAKSSLHAPTRTQRRPAISAPKANRPEANSRSGNGSGSKPSLKNESRQPRKAKG
jgi:hypothetical protein